MKLSLFNAFLRETKKSGSGLPREASY